MLVAQPHEKNKALAVPTWSFCKILGSVGKQGQGRKRRIPIDFGARLGIAKKSLPTPDEVAVRDAKNNPLSTLKHRV